MLDISPYVQWWGMRLAGLAPGQATIELPFRPELARPGGFVHGAAVVIMADVSFWLALMTRIGVEPMAVTLELKTNYLRPAFGDLRTVARLLHVGRRAAFGDASSFDSSGVLVAHHTLTYMRPQKDGVADGSQATESSRT
jgi:uncharacterized protein (TIGR00369 family)